MFLITLGLMVPSISIQVCSQKTSDDTLIPIVPINLCFWLLKNQIFHSPDENGNHIGKGNSEINYIEANRADSEISPESHDSFKPSNGFSNEKKKEHKSTRSRRAPVKLADEVTSSKIKHPKEKKSKESKKKRNKKDEQDHENVRNNKKGKVLTHFYGIPIQSFHREKTGHCAACNEQIHNKSSGDRTLTCRGKG